MNRRVRIGYEIRDITSQKGRPGPIVSDPYGLQDMTLHYNDLEARDITFDGSANEKSLLECRLFNISCFCLDMVLSLVLVMCYTLTQVSSSFCILLHYSPSFHRIERQYQGCCR